MPLFLAASPTCCSTRALGRDRRGVLRLLAAHSEQHQVARHGAPPQRQPRPRHGAALAAQRRPVLVVGGRVLGGDLEQRLGGAHEAERGLPLQVAHLDVGGQRRLERGRRLVQPLLRLAAPARRPSARPTPRARTRDRAPSPARRGRATGRPGWGPPRTGTRRGSGRGAMVMLARPTFSDRGTRSSSGRRRRSRAQGTIAFSSLSNAEITSAPTPPILRSLRDGLQREAMALDRDEVARARRPRGRPT